MPDIHDVGQQVRKPSYSRAKAVAKSSHGIDGAKPEYINTFVKGKLLRAKRRLALEGRWFGGRVPPGYLFDTRKNLPDGSLNPHWSKYTPFEPYAEVINEYFRLFLSYAGNMNATLRHIHEQGPYYPDPQSCLPPFGSQFTLKA